MAYGLPALGETTWGQKILDSFAALKATADAAQPAATLDAAVTAVDADDESDLRVQQDARLAATFGVTVPYTLGTGTGDQLAAINAIVQANPGRPIRFPAGPLGTAIYQIAGDAQGILLDAPGTDLIIEDGASIRVATNALDSYAAVTIKATDCAVIDGTITGDLDTHTGGTGEWGHGIAILEGAHRARVENTRLTKFWGDGICVSDTSTSFTTGARPADVQINNVVCDDNRRQGMSIIAALRLRINGGVFMNTGQTTFTAPGAGIAVETNAGGLQEITDLVVTGAVLTRNKGRGIYCYSNGTPLTATFNAVRSIDNDAEGFSFDYDSEVLLNGCVADENGVTGGTSMDGFYVAATATAAVTFNGCKARRNTLMGFATLSDDAVFSTCQADENGWAGFASTGDRTKIVACTAQGNNQVSNFYGQFRLDGGADAQIIGCTSEAGEGATKVTWGYQIAGGATNAQVIGCVARGAFAGGAYTEFGSTGTIAMPIPGVAKQTGVTVDAAGIHAALVNLGLITA